MKDLPKVSLFTFSFTCRYKSNTITTFQESVESNFKQDLEKRNWRDYIFDKKSATLPLRDNDTIRVCSKTNHANGACCYALCRECFNRASESGGRLLRCKKTEQNLSNSDKHNNCRHGLHDLQDETNPWWCNPHAQKDGLFTYNWLIRVKGCVGCQKMFVLKPKKDWKVGKLDDNIKSQYGRLNNGDIYNQYLEMELSKKGKAGTKKTP